MVADPAEFIYNAIAPAEVDQVIWWKWQNALVVVPDNKLSLAIGRRGQNVAWQLNWQATVSISSLPASWSYGRKQVKWITQLRMNWSKNRSLGGGEDENKKIPLRKSVVSNEVIDKRDLLRIVKNKEGQVFIDPTGRPMAVALISS